MVSQGGGANLERYVFFKGGWGHKRKREKEKGKKENLFAPIQFTSGRNYP